MLLTDHTLQSMAVVLVRRREEQSAKLRKTAEKLLLNQLKKHALGKFSASQQEAVLQAQQSVAVEDDNIPADLRVSARAKLHLH